MGLKALAQDPWLNKCGSHLILLSAVDMPTMKVDGKWVVDTSYIKHLAVMGASAEAIESRRSETKIGNGEPHLCAGTSPTTIANSTALADLSLVVVSVSGDLMAAFEIKPSEKVSQVIARVEAVEGPVELLYGSSPLDPSKSLHAQDVPTGAVLTMVLCSEDEALASLHGVWKYRHFEQTCYEKLDVSYEYKLHADGVVEYNFLDFYIEYDPDGACSRDEGEGRGQWKLDGSKILITCDGHNLSFDREAFVKQYARQ